MRIAITGATGMVGQACIDRFVTRGDDVVALLRKPSGQMGNATKRISIHVTDYSRSDLRLALRGIEAIVHLGAMRPNAEADAIGYRPYFEANVQTTENLLCAALDEGVKTFCLASSISVYSLYNQVPYQEKDNPFPLSLYGASKLACEHLVGLYARQGPLRWVSLRIAQILGPDKSRSEAMLMRFMTQARKKEKLTLWGTGAGARDAVYIKDVVAAFEVALDQGSPSGIFNIGGGRAFSNREIAETINEVFDNEGNFTIDASRPEDTSVFYMDGSRAETELGWRRQWDLRSGFEDMQAHYR